MSRTQKKFAKLSTLLAALALIALQQTDGNAAGVMGIMRAKTLPAETVAVLNPEGGQSGGTEGSEVNLAEGDIILFRFEWTPAPQNIAWGINHYLTEYVPDNLELVGVRLLDKETLEVIKPDFPGRTLDGCATCSDTEINCRSTVDADESCTFSNGSVAQLYGDTGFFYALRADEPNLVRRPDDDFLELTTGDPSVYFDGSADVTPAFVFPTFSPVLGVDTSGVPFYGHNYWDYINVLIFGTKNGNQSVSSGSGGGAPPHGYGSPVAGSGAGYTMTPVPGDGFQSASPVDPVAEDIELNGDTGPWSRIRYPGSHKSVFGAPSSTNDIRVITDASTQGYDLVPANSLPSGAIIRAALGGVPAGKAFIVEVAARVDADFASDLVIDPDQGANVNCGEIFGGDGGRDVGTENNMWSLYAPLAQCVILRAQVDIQTDKPLCASSGDLVTFTVNVKNLAVLTDEDVVVRLQCNQGSSCTDAIYNGGNYTLPDGASATLDPECDAMDINNSCINVNLGDLGSFQEREITVSSNSCNPGAEFLILRANYTSAGNTESPENADILGPLPIPGFTTTEVTRTRLIGVPEVTASWDETNDPKYVVDVASADRQTPVSGTLANVGSGSLTYSDVQFNLPSGWTIVGNSVDYVDTDGANGTASCAVAPDDANAYRCDFSETIAAGGNAITFDFDLNIPMGTASGNYPIDIEPFLVFGSFYKEGSYVERELITVTVQNPRTDAPELGCPIVSSAGSEISGTLTTEPAGTTVYLYINKILRGETTTDGSGNWTIDINEDCLTATFPLAPGEYCFGELYGGLEIYATAENTADSENESLPSAQCPGGVRSTKQCSDGIDNDSDGFIDFPSDVGCQSPSDNNETDDADSLAPECSNAENDDGAEDSDIDFGADLQCYGPDDDDESDFDAPSGDPLHDNSPCDDGIDNDGDGLIDTDGANNDNVDFDPSCAENLAWGINSERDYGECNNIIDDGDGDAPLADFRPTHRNAIVAVDAGADEISVAGDITSLLGTAGFNLRIKDSTGNNGVYKATSVTYSNPNTDIILDEDITDATVDGFIEYISAGDPGCHTAYDLDESDVGSGSDIIKPRILFVFDTSGSMNEHVCAKDGLETDSTGGDGSFECPGGDLIDPDNTICPAGAATANDDIANDSRLFKVKEGISDVIASFGEVEYALMRFKQQPREFGCFDGFGSGGWQGGGVAPLGTPYATACQPFNSGELIVDWSVDNVPSLLKWMDHDSNYGERYEVSHGAFTDQTTGIPYGFDWELRGTGSTPLAGALESAREVIYQEIVDDDPAVRSCRPYRVILITDGLESCSGAPQDVAGEIFAGGAGLLPGGGDAPPIPVRVIGFGDPELQSGLDTIANQGATVDGSPAPAIVVDSEADLSNALAAIISEAIVTEWCDGIDNDCDSRIDEGYGIYNEPVGSIDFGDESGARTYPTCTNTQLGDCEEVGTLRCAGAGPGAIDRNTQVVCCDTPETSSVVDDEWEGNRCLTEVGTNTPQTEECGGGDEDCDGKIDESGAGDVPPPDPLLSCNCVTEVCDGEDNDCDGATDENTVEEPLPGVGADCGTTVGACVLGEYTCFGGTLECCAVGDPTCSVPPEYPQDENDLATDCNQIDDDCDGRTDEVIEACWTGPIVETDPQGRGCPSDTSQPCLGVCRRGVNQCVDPADDGATAPRNTGCSQVLNSDEICDGLDNDCDGSVDEDFQYEDPLNPGTFYDIGDVCPNGEQGICAANGVVRCTGDLTFECDAPVINPQPEICNNIDDDCDGPVDETTPGTGDDVVGSPVGDICNAGTCGEGLFECQGGIVVCVGGNNSETEVCDGVDNNCNGQVDENFPELGQVCDDGNLNADPVTNPLLGECQYGDTVCTGGGLVCDGYIGPTPEICDGLDNDCDGVIDDAAPCDAGEICLGGACVAPCQAGEFPCGFGFYCGAVEGQTDSFCLVDPCVNIDCGEGFFCESATGTCIDLCGDVECLEGAICRDGFCLDCFAVPCPDGEICKQNDIGVGVCEVDPCAGVECDTDGGEFCVEGTCRTVNCNPECASDERCVNGVCEADPCDGVVCPSGRVCRQTDGECIFDDLCADVGCFGGEVCNPGTGECIEDPCNGINCPTGTFCTVDTAGEGVCAEPKGDRVYAGGGGGCNAAGPGTGSTSLMLLLLAGFGFISRRRRLLSRNNS